MVIFTIPHVESQTDSSSKSSHFEVDCTVKAEGRDGYSRAVKCPVFKSVVHSAEEERTLHFIQDLQLVNKVTIRNAEIRPTIDEFAEAFTRRSIYYVGNLYSGYDQFQLVVESRDITTMQIPLGLVQVCTLPQGGTNLVVYMVNVMNKVLRHCIPDITMPFLEDILIKGCRGSER